MPIFLGLIVLSIAIAIGIGSRLSEQTVAALAGAVCGVGMAAPAGFAFGMYVGSTRARIRSTQTPAQSPQVIVLPTATQAAPHVPTAQQYPFMPRPAMPAPRSFKIIGDGDEDIE